MPSPYQHNVLSHEAQEKCLVPRTPSRVDDDGGNGSAIVAEADWSPWNIGGSTLGQIITKMPFCTPCSGYETPSGYQSVPTSTSFDYVDSRPYQAEMTSPLLGEAPFASSGTIDVNDVQPASFAWDSTPNLREYPPLQPTTTGEDMVYPVAIADSRFSRTQDTESRFPASGPQGGPQSKPQSSGLTDNGLPYLGGVMPVTGASSFAPTEPRSLGASSGFGRVPGYLAVETTSPGHAGRVDLQSRTSGLDVVFPNQRPPPAKRGPFKTHMARQQTAHTRKIGSCIRCRMQRIRCEPDTDAPEDDETAPCLKCKRVSGSKIWRLPCRRWKITDVKLFKPGQVEGYEWTQRWKDSILDDIGNWASSEIKTIRVTEGYTGDFVQLKVRQFIPQEGDKLERSWVVDGVKRSVPIPPYAIVDMEEAKSAYDNYIKRGLVECCKHLLGPREKLLWKTYGLAMKVMRHPSTSEEERELIRSTLDLWMSIRLTTKSFEIVGDETLGMSHDIMDDTSPLRGSIPLPPVMGAQIDSILLHQTLPKLRRDTLETLQTITQKKAQRTWLTTYLVTFILLHNVALITKHDAGYARKHGMKRRFAREDMVRQYHQGANVLLAYFHYCNKGVFPFSAECKDQDLQTLAELDDSNIAFVRYTRDYATEHKREWEDLWHEQDFENDYYFISQLFQHSWQPRETI
ncbi:Tetratricopeptide repeat domain containing protein [Pleurostoma richardsiae]|uniref:Tetratricopeptide repeat domain containing protein n=1 Tax=Pleurostoma richardsiae TaxID=41990 RepID=A0AA38VGT3_9PEZI|nr:Tetratricopeptide repeat domain containing protein [Pleurostoma richardsiae]